jgi:hypothetical protein
MQLASLNLLVLPADPATVPTHLRQKASVPDSG